MKKCLLTGVWALSPKAALQFWIVTYPQWHKMARDFPHSFLTLCTISHPSPTCNWCCLACWEAWLTFPVTPLLWNITANKQLWRSYTNGCNQSWKEEICQWSVSWRIVVSNIPLLPLTITFFIVSSSSRALQWVKHMYDELPLWQYTELLVFFIICFQNIAIDSSQWCSCYYNNTNGN